MQTFDPFIDVAHRKVGDGHPLRHWPCTTDIEATPLEIMQFIFKERRQWDTYLMKCRIVEQLDEYSEIFQYANGGHVITDYRLLRYINVCLHIMRKAYIYFLRTKLTHNTSIIWLDLGERIFCVETSVEDADAHLLLLGGVRGVILASRYLIEPICNGKSKICIWRESTPSKLPFFRT